MANVTRIGFGQIEPTHLSAQRTGQIYAQLPADDFDVLENGQFVKYDYGTGKCNLTGKGEWMLVYNEIKLYDGWRETYKDFALQKKNFTPGAVGQAHHTGYVGAFDGQMVPRVFKTNIGDIFTTNCLGAAAATGKDVVDSGLAEEDLAPGKFLKVGPKGYLVKAASETDGDMVWVVCHPTGGAAKVVASDWRLPTTMADGQRAVRLQRIK